MTGVIDYLGEIKWDNGLYSNKTEFEYFIGDTQCLFGYGIGNRKFLGKVGYSVHPDGNTKSSDGTFNLQLKEGNQKLYSGEW